MRCEVQRVRWGPCIRRQIEFTPVACVRRLWELAFPLTVCLDHTKVFRLHDRLKSSQAKNGDWHFFIANCTKNGTFIVFIL